MSWIILHLLELPSFETSPSSNVWNGPIDHSSSAGVKPLEYLLTLYNETKSGSDKSSI